MQNHSTVVIFGGSGAIGGALCSYFLTNGWRVIAVSRSGQPSLLLSGNISWLSLDIDRDQVATVLAQLPLSIDAVIWAQGQNASDDVYSVQQDTHDALYRANVGYVLQTLQVLLADGHLAKPSRLCVISSIWQNIARQQKLSYCVTKAALQGLVQSAAIDLGCDGHLINAILPGALDTPMTRTNLKPEQIARLESETPIGRLPSLDDVCNLAGFLCSPANTGVTGQFIAVDGGFSYARKL